MIDTLRLSAEEATGLLERRELSSDELLAAYRDAIAARDPELHCFLTTVDEPSGDGVPIALKDVIGTKGVRTTAGSRILERYVPVYDSTVAARCKAAGLPLLGKTNTDEFAMGSSTENSAYGPTRNPWDPEGVGVGVPKELNGAEGIEPGVSAAVARAIETCRELGADVAECELPRSVDYGLPCYYLIAPAEASSNLARYDGVRFGLRAGDGDFEAMQERTRDEGFGDEPKRRIMLGTYALSAGYYDAFYGQEQKGRTIIKREHDTAFDGFDVLVSPTSPTVAFRLGERTEDPLAMYLSDLLTIPSCIAGLA